MKKKKWLEEFLYNFFQILFFAHIQSKLNNIYILIKFYEDHPMIFMKMKKSKQRRRINENDEPTFILCVCIYIYLYIGWLIS